MQKKRTKLALHTCLRFGFILLKTTANITFKILKTASDASCRLQNMVFFFWLLQKLRYAFNESSRKPLLTAAVAAPYDIVKKAYDIKVLSRY